MDDVLAFLDFDVAVDEAFIKAMVEAEWTRAINYLPKALSDLSPYKRYTTTRSL